VLGLCGGFSVVARCRFGKLRRAVGWIAAYALVLNTILTGLLVVPHASADPSSQFEAAIVCLSGHTAGDSGQVVPNGTPPSGWHSVGHCALCVVSAFATAPAVAVVIGVLGPASLPALRPLSERATTGSLNSLPGRPRAPPVNHETS
jgi:hypothetical protein